MALKKVMKRGRPPVFYYLERAKKEYLLKMLVRVKMARIKYQEAAGFEKEIKAKKAPLEKCPHCEAILNR
jgi:hypothetical protein